jgi:hypothetical protein
MANFVLTYTAAGASVGIEIEKPSSLVAPAQVWLRAVDHDGLAAFEESGTVYDGAHHEYYHEWTINGEPLPAWSKPQNLLAEHNNPNKAFGREVAFVLPEPGHYVIDLVVTDRLGNQATASTGTVIVFDPESYFPPADRIYVDNTGVYADVPAASGKVQTLEQLNTAMASRTTNPTWVLLKRGQEHSLEGVNPGGNGNSIGVLSFRDTTEVRMISAYGTGAKPVVTPNRRADRNFTRNMFEVYQPKSDNWRTITGIDFRGDYNPETERGHCGYAAGFRYEPWDIAGGFALVHDVEVSGVDKGFAPSGTSNGGSHRQLIADCAVDGWRDFASFGGNPGAHIGFVGNRFRQLPNVPNFGSKDDVRNTHGPIRVSDCAYVYASQMDLFSRNHWDGNDQACLRLFTRPEAVQAATVERCTMEGGWEVIHCRKSEGPTIRPANILLEKLFLVSSTYTNVFLNCQRSGVTLRDSVMIRTNVPVFTSSGPGDAVSFNAVDNGAEADAYNNPVAVYGNTYVNLLDAANEHSQDKAFASFEAPAFNNTIDENNVHHKPTGTHTHVEFAPIDLSTAVSGFDRRYLGLRYNFDTYTKTLTEDIPEGGTFSWPYADTGDGLFEGTPSTGPTDQAYWQALIGTDDLHQVNVMGAGPRRYHAEQGHIGVSFADATNIVITNNTGETWLTGKPIILWLDRSSLMPEIDSTYATPETVPLPRPQTGSAAIGAATAGRVSPTDFLLTDRGTTPSKGALEPSA